MPKKLLYCFILGLLSYTNHSAQGNRKVMHGKIVSDSLSVARIHIINENTQRGTTTNAYGDFAIPAKVNDTLVFSALQYKIYRRIVSAEDLQKLQVLIELKPQVNELDEIIIKPISMAKQLNLPNADKKPLTKLEARLNGHTKASTPIVILGTLIGGAGGLDNLYYVLSGKRKKDRKLKKLLDEDKMRNLDNITIKQIKQYYKNDFFTQTVGIPIEEIDNFIDFCLKDDIITLYNTNKHLEIVEIFLREKDLFLEEIKE